jgi:subtilisin family serine protease
VVQDVSVINMSLSGPKNKVLESSIDKVLQQGKVIVAAAGNNGPQGPPAYPAASKGVIAITAVDRFQRPYPRANRGRYIDFAAPGVAIWTPCIVGSGRFRSGTSYAAAYFTAMAAEQLNRPGMRQGHKALRKVFRKRALDLGPPGKDPVYGWGLVRCP